MGRGDVRTQLNKATVSGGRVSQSSYWKKAHKQKYFLQSKRRDASRREGRVPPATKDYKKSVRGSCLDAALVARCC